MLIVDDEQDIRKLLATVLRDNGFEVATASDGEEAFKEIAREKPRLIILDLLMPGISGEEVCRRIKEDPALRNILVMILSAKDDLQCKLSCLNMGAEEYLVKPIDMDELVARVNRFLLLVQQIQMQQPEPTDPSAATVIVPDPNATWIPHERTQPTLHVPEGAEVTPTASEPVKPIDPIQVQKSKYGVYRVENLAGVGGMGLVYKAYDEVLDRYVAVKVLSKGWSDAPEFLAQFHKEAKLIASINHPRIAPVYTFGEQDGESYFALQWCSGGSVSDLIKRNGKIDLLQSIDLVLQCARGLQAAYLKGVVHRDVKPSNLMFDEGQYIKIVDFGVAFKESVGEKAAGSQPVIGSPSYMAPEQARGAGTDHRTDIYSLGITFYQMLYGRFPFSAKSPLEWIKKHAEAPFPPYDDSGGKIPLKAYEIILKMTQKKADARYQNYPDLIRDLEHLRNELYSQRRLKIPAAVRMEKAPALKMENFFDLLATLFRQERTGLLKASWGQLQKTFLIHRNEIVGFESPQTDENFWNELVNRNLMKKEFVPPPAEGLEKSVNRLLFLQACAPEDFKAIYREMMTRSLIQIFQWPSFQGEFYLASIENEPFSRVSISSVLMAAARTVVSYETVTVSASRSRPLVRTPKFENIIAGLNLPQAENFLASRIEGESVTVESLTWLTGFSEEQVSRTVYAWERMGALEYRSPIQRKKYAQTAASQSQTSAPIAEPVFIAAKPPAESQKPNWKQSLSGSDPESAAKYYEMAEANYKAGKYWEAERNCVRAIKNNPSVAKYHHLMAMALSQHSHSIKAAEESFRQTIELDPQNPQFRLDFAIFLNDHGRYEDALEQCDEILATTPYTPQAIELRKQLELKI